MNEQSVNNRKINNSAKMLMIDALIFAIGILSDQLTKVQIRKTLPIGSSIDLIPGVFQFLHHENFGASWGIMQGKTVLFLIIATVVVIGLGYFLTRIPAEKKYLPLNIAAALILAGALGNTTDRIMKQSVTDFLYFKLINFPIFNVADIYIVVATFGVAILFLFIYKEEDLKFLDSGKNSSDKKAEDN